MQIFTRLQTVSLSIRTMFLDRPPKNGYEKPRPYWVSSSRRVIGYFCSNLVQWMILLAYLIL